MAVRLSALRACRRNILGTHSLTQALHYATNVGSNVGQNVSQIISTLVRQMYLLHGVANAWTKEFGTNACLVVKVEDTDFAIAAAAVVVLSCAKLVLENKKRKRRTRRWWTLSLDKRWFECLGSQSTECFSYKLINSIINSLLYSILKTCKITL
jgi:hypothetical protein